MSNQQNAYLKAMGIDVWLERNPSNTSSQETSQPVTSQSGASHHVETNVKQA